jgi:serine/threonine protein kinase
MVQWHRYDALSHHRMQPSASHIPGFEPTQRYTAPSPNALVPGTRLNDYEIIRVLGEGGFSIVYLAQDETLQRRVAVKEYLPVSLAVRGNEMDVALRTVSHSETFAQGLVSFVNEARLLARFDHPSLVRVLHFWKANGTAYMVMPYFEGSTLVSARQAMTRPPDETWLRALILSLLGALEVLHTASCFHRDIAPDNILLLPDGRPLLLDFGAARRVIGERTHQLTAILKPAFAPIEQYAESTHLQQGPWTDLYALGAVARYCITGDVPMPSTVRALHDELPPLADEVRALRAKHLGLSYSANLLATIDWALGVRPSDRPQSVAQFREAMSKPFVMPVLQVADEAPADAPLHADDRSDPHEPRIDDTPRIDLSDLHARGSSGPQGAEAWRPPRGGNSRAQRPPAVPRAAVWGLTFLVLATLLAGGWKWNQLRETNMALDAMSNAQREPALAPTPPSTARPAAPTAPATAANASVVPTPLPPTAAGNPAPVNPAPAAPQAAQSTVTEANTQPAVPPRRSDGTPPRVTDGARAQANRPNSAAVIEPDNPRAICAPRQQFALYYCMQTQCQTSRFYAHPQCIDLRRRDDVE